MKTELKEFEVTQEDKELLQKVDYAYMAYRELLLGGVVSDLILDKYESAYVAYRVQWDKILKHYASEITMAFSAIDYICDYSSNIVTIYEI